MMRAPYPCPSCETYNDTGCPMCKGKGMIDWRTLLSTEREVFNLPETASERKRFPVTTGVLDYFPDAIAEIARVSWQGNDQHNPGQPLHWAREKSMDHADCIGRHLLQRGTVDTDGMRHSAKLAWRALALLQVELEEERDEDRG